jgi:hypothetical protein
LAQGKLDEIEPDGSAEDGERDDDEDDRTDNSYSE